MRTVTITLNNAVLIDEVSKLSSFEGGRLKDANGVSLYDTIKIKKQDSPLLDTYIREAVNKLTSASNEYLTYLDAGSGIITVKLPTTFPAILEPELQEVAGNYVVNLVFALWMIHNAIEPTSKEYMAISEQNLIDYIQKLYTRNKPVLPATHVTP